MRVLLIDCQYKLPCPHAAAGKQNCGVGGCDGVDYSTAVVKDILLNDIADADIKREILGDATRETRSVQEVVTVVEGKEAASDAVASGRLSQAAASSSYKSKRGRPLATPPSTASSSTGLPHRPREKKCWYGNAYFNFAERANGGWNNRPYKECRDCFLGFQARA